MRHIGIGLAALCVWWVADPACARPKDPYCPIGDFNQEVGCVVTYRLDPLLGDAPLGRLSAAEIERQVLLAMEGWKSVVPVEFQRLPSPRPADIYFVTHEGPPGIAHWRPATHGLSFRSTEDWAANLCEGGGRYSFIGTAVHELGHALGLDHQPPNTSSVMTRSLGRWCPHQYPFLKREDPRLMREQFTAVFAAMEVPEPGAGLLLLSSLVWLIPRRPHRDPSPRRSTSARA